jgi:hypothetical protein
MSAIDYEKRRGRVGKLTDGQLKQQLRRDHAYRKRMEARGMVQVRYWIPEDERQTIDRYIEKKRRAALRG